MQSVSAVSSGDKKCTLVLAGKAVLTIRFYTARVLCRVLELTSDVRNCLVEKYYGGVTIRASDNGHKVASSPYR